MFIRGEARDAETAHLGSFDETQFSRFIGSEAILYAQSEALFIIPRENVPDQSKQ